MSAKTKLTYGVVEASSSEKLVELVNKELDDGWNLQGGICQVYDDANFWFAQALTKEVPIDN